MTLEALLCLEHQLRSEGDAEAADDLHEQVTTLSGVAEAWRHSARDQSRILEEASAAL